MRFALRASLLAGILLPLTAIAAAQLQVEQTIAGLDTTATISGVSAGDIALHMLLPSGDDARIIVRATGAANQKTSIPGDYLQEAGDYRAFLESDSGGRLTGEATFTVLPDSVDAQVSQMESDVKTLSSDSVSAATVTVTLRDGYGNLLSGRPVQLVGSRLEDKITPLSTTTNTSGQQQFSVTSSKAGTVFLRALDMLSSVTLDARIELTVTDRAAAGPATGLNGDLSRYYGYQNPWTVPYYPTYPPAYGNPYAAQLTAPAPAAATSTAGSVDSFEITLNPKQPHANQTFTITIRAVGTDGRTAQDYTGTLKITAPDDAGAILPGLTEDGQGQAKFIPKNLGVKVMSLSTSFSTAGTHTLHVEDTTSIPGRAIIGDVTVAVLGAEGPSPDHLITFTSPLDGATVTNPTVTVTGLGPALRNLTVTGGMASVEAESDDKGNFTFTVQLDPQKTSHTLHVEDDSTDVKQRFSGDLNLTLGAPPADDTPPVFTVKFSPSSPMEGEDVTLTVQSEEQNLVVAFSLGDQNLSLTADPLSPGDYTVLFRAPIAGTYPASIVATDAAGNPGIQTAKVTVQATDIPVVQNVIAQPRIGGVDLAWDELADPRVTSFVVYVGTSPQNFSFTLDTAKVTAGASVMGLDAGKTYYFAVTAKTALRESAKSAVITSAPLGLGLSGVPGAGSVQLTWTFPGEAITVKGFTLEYGTSVRDLLETRSIPEKVRTMLVSDLIPGVSYTFRMTPVSAAGEPLMDMAADITVTPLSVDPLHPAASEPLPFDSTPPDNALHAGAETNTGTGLPSAAMIAATVFSALVILIAAKRRRALRSEKVFITRAREQYNRF